MITAPATKDAQRAVLAIPMIVVNTTLIFLRYSFVIKMIKSVEPPQGLLRSWTRTNLSTPHNLGLLIYTLFQSA